MWKPSFLLYLIWYKKMCLKWFETTWYMDTILTLKTVKQKENALNLNILSFYHKKSQALHYFFNYSYGVLLRSIQFHPTCDRKVIQINHIIDFLGFVLNNFYTTRCLWIGFIEIVNFVSRKNPLGVSSRTHIGIF